MERNFVKNEEKEKFGKGSVQGLSAPETANNAACSGSFVPLLTLGIPEAELQRLCLVLYWVLVFSQDQDYMKLIQISLVFVVMLCTLEWSYY